MSLTLAGAQRGQDARRAPSNMGCHYVDLPFWALGLSAPTNINATFHKGPEGDQDAPDVITIDYSFPARGENPAVHLTWYSGLTGDGAAAEERRDSGEAVVTA